MNIATWNLNRASAKGSRGRRIRRHLAEHEVDVWVLTETSTDLSPGPDWRGVFSDPRSDARRDERWVAVWARGGEFEPLPTGDPDRTAAAWVRSREGEELVVYGTVLPWLGSPWRDHAAADGVAFRAALECQARDRAKLSSAHPEAGLCVAGDLNQDLEEAGHHYGSKKGRDELRNALARAGLVCLTGGASDPVARTTSGARANIDHICVSRGLAADTRSWAWPASAEELADLSDHFGVGVQL